MSDLIKALKKIRKTKIEERYREPFKDLMRPIIEKRPLYKTKMQKMVEEIIRPDKNKELERPLAVGNTVHLILSNIGIYQDVSKFGCFDYGTVASVSDDADFVLIQLPNNHIVMIKKTDIY